MHENFFSANSKNFSIGRMKILRVVYISKLGSEKRFSLWKSRFETRNIEISLETRPPPKVIEQHSEEIHCDTPKSWLEISLRFLIFWILKKSWKFTGKRKNESFLLIFSWRRHVLSEQFLYYVESKPS